MKDHIPRSTLIQNVDSNVEKESVESGFTPSAPELPSPLFL
jgi:hypothetical protein